MTMIFYNKNQMNSLKVMKRTIVCATRNMISITKQRASGITLWNTKPSQWGSKIPFKWTLSPRKSRLLTALKLVNLVSVVE